MIRIRTPEEIGPALRTARKDAGLTQTQLADKAGFRQSQINAWEQGWNRPNLASTIRLFGAMGGTLGIDFPEDT